MIKNLLFDLGGVIMNLDRMRCVRALEALGMPDAAEMLGEYGQKGPFLALEKGEITPDEFHHQMRPLFNRPVTDDEIDRAFDLFLTGIPVGRLKALRELRRRGYGIYLLSNTNPIMWRGVIANEFGKEGLRREDYFDGMVTSFDARAAKPDARIFTYTADHLCIEPAETLFFDDSTANVEAARRLGFEAVHVAPGTEFTDYIPE